MWSVYRARLMNSLAQIQILVADDNEINRRFVVEALRSEVSEVLETDNGQQAVSICTRLRPDVLLLDIHMPGMDGLETLNRIISNTTGDKYKPIAVALTADARQAEKERLLANGFDAFLSKPVSSNDILQCINSLLSNTEVALQAEQISDLRPEPVLDDQKALRATNGSWELLQTLRQMFSEELRVTCAELESRLQSGHYEPLAEQLHKLIASAGYCGASRLSRSARDLYESLLLQDLSRIGTAYATFLGQSDEVQRQLQAYR